MGPEVGFGWALGDYYDSEVLLIKVAWGGKSLAVNFRPPSSGIYYNGTEPTSYSNGHTLPYGEAWGAQPYPESEYGKYYHKTVATRLAPLDKLP